MQVLLLGVAADTTNCSPTPPIYEDGRFEYISIPESEGPEGTTESRTYGNTELRHTSGTLADYLDSIKPGGEYDEWLSDSELENWPLHYDPNFDALTYGESNARPDYIKKLRLLEPGDVVAFYTGLRSRQTSGRARYLIGYFTVRSILDLRQVQKQNTRVTFSDLPTKEERQIMRRHAENAHAKRFLATGSLKVEDDGVVIVDGKEPGERLEKAVRISEHRGSGHHYLSNGFKSKLWPEQDPSTTEDYYLGGIKQPHLLEVDEDVFHRIVS